MPRNPFWEDTFINEDTPSGADDLQTLVGGLSEDERRGMTVVRTLIDLWLTPTISSGVVGSMTMNLGIGVCNAQAFAAGSASLPSPSINSERPPRGWIWRAGIAIMDDATTVPTHSRVTADVRSKRKVDAGVLYIHMDAILRTGTPFNVKTTGLIRTLYLMA